MNRNLTFLNSYIGCERPKDKMYTALDLFIKPELIETVQHKSGIYIIMSPTQKFIYPLGASPMEMERFLIDKTSHRDASFGKKES